MQSEHLTNLHPGWVLGGWLIAAAVTSAVYLGSIGLGLVPAGSGAVLWVVASMAIGFFTGGFFVGLRWTEAPVLHGAAIAGVSVVIWFLATFIDPASPFDSLSVALGIILLQATASSLGGWAGRRTAGGANSGQP